MVSDWSRLSIAAYYLLADSLWATPVADQEGPSPRGDPAGSLAAWPGQRLIGFNSLRRKNLQQAIRNRLLPLPVSPKAVNPRGLGDGSPSIYPHQTVKSPAC